MSLRALTWAFDLQHEEMTSTMKLVLITLANYADEDGKTYPRQNTIAEKALLSRQCVNKNLAKLEELGFIKMIQRKHAAGGLRSSLYLLAVPVTERINDDDQDGDWELSTRATRAANDNDKGRHPERQPLSSSTTRVVNQDDTLNRVLEPSPEPPKEPERKPGKKRGPAADWPEDAFDQFWSIYPRKDGKKNARASFNRISEAGNVEFNALMEGLRLYTNKDDFRDWCWPATWLNGDRWEDRPKQKKVGVAKPKRTVAI